MSISRALTTTSAIPSVPGGNARNVGRSPSVGSKLPLRNPPHTETPSTSSKGPSKVLDPAITTRRVAGVSIMLARRRASSSAAVTVRNGRARVPSGDAAPLVGST
jgi:hypothetical protein